MLTIEEMGDVVESRDYHERWKRYHLFCLDADLLGRKLNQNYELRKTRHCILRRMNGMWMDEGFHR